MPAIDHETYTIESLIAELTSVAAARGWGAQSLTNISFIKSTSGDREVQLLTGDEEDIESLKSERDDLERDDLERDLRSAEYHLENVEDERDALRRRVEELTGEVLTLKEAARDMTA